MKLTLATNRTKALLGIGLIAIGIGVITKIIITFQSKECIRSSQEISLNREIKIIF